MNDRLLFWAVLIIMIVLGVRVNAQSRFSNRVLNGGQVMASKNVRQLEAMRLNAVLDMPLPLMLQPVNGAINVPVIPQFLIGTVNGGSTYYVQVASDSEFSNIISNSWETFNFPTTSNSSFVFYSGIQDPSAYSSGITYYWRVMVADSSGQNTSGWSEPYSYTTLPPAAPVGTPTLLSPASYETTSWINTPFSWSATPGATSYQLQYTDNSSAFYGHGTFYYYWLNGGQTSDTIPLSPNTTYYWRVIGYNDGSVGQFSEVRTLYTGTKAVLTVPNGTFGIGAGSYTSGLDLQWLIEPPAAIQITLSFSSFSTVAGYDYVTVYDGSTTSSPVLGQFSGSGLPSSVTSSSGVMLVEFTTSYYGTAQGWTANYSSSISKSFVKNAVLLQLTNGPSQTNYSVPQNSVGYVYFGMTSGRDSVSYDQSFQINLIDQARNAHVVDAILIRPGILRISIPNSLIGSSVSTFSISDSIPIGSNIYVLQSSPPTFQISVVPQECDRTIDFFAEGSAGVSGILGGVGVGASIAAAKLSISGTGGMGFSVSIDADNNLTLSRRMDYGLAASLEVPSVNFVVGQVGALNLNGSAKAVISQDLSFEGAQSIISDQEKMAEAGFVLETLANGFSNLSPLVGPLIQAINQTLIGDQVSQIIENSIVKTSWGSDFEGGISAGFNGNVGPIKLSLANGSITGAFSFRVNSFPKGLPDMSNVTSSYSFSEASSFDFSSLNFGVDFDGVSLSNNNWGVFDVGAGMETGAEAFFNSSGQFDHMNLWLDGGGDLSVLGTGAQTYYKTVIDIPGEYRNILARNIFAVNGLLADGNLLDVGNLTNEMPSIVGSVSTDFAKDPITFTTYEKDGNGYDFNFGLNLDAALGAGLGLSIGFDTRYYDEVSYIRKYTAVYANNQSYLLYSSSYPSTNLNNFSLRAFYNDLFSGAAGLAKAAFLNLIQSVTQTVSAGVTSIINVVDQAGNYVGGLVGSAELDGQWAVSTFSAAFPHMWASPFHKPIIRNVYYSTKVQHKLHINKITKLTQGSTTMVAVSKDMKISFTPNGQATSIDSVNTPFEIKMLIDTSELSQNGFTLADSSRIGIYRYDDHTNSWILEAGVLNGDTIEAMVTHMSNYVLGIELTSVGDTIPPDIYEYGPRQDTLTQYPMLYARIKDDQYGVGVDWTKTYIIANGDTLNTSFDPTNQMIFYNLSDKDKLGGNVRVTVSTSDYDGNISSIQFGFLLTNVMEKNIPTRFSLSQNYPNPFNPTTTINFTLAKESDVEMVVYNSIGQYVTTLMKKRMTIGSYSVDFDGSRLASGIYFCSFTAKPGDGDAEYRETRKMTLIK